MYPSCIQKLITLFSKLPTVGPRTAARFVFYLLKASDEEVKEISEAISVLKSSVKQCSFCFNPFEGDGTLCEICRNPRRDQTMLCVVEKETDLVPIEKTKKYQGRYFILGGVLSKFNREDLKNLRTEKLLARASQKEIQEIILAFNSTIEGEATSLYIERLLQKNLPAGRRVTRLGRGLPLGGELEYADEETLSSALDGRK
ncbi:MAG: recombination mediator RecR [Candidatus Nealsonbacteria bacterium]